MLDTRMFDIGEDQWRYYKLVLERGQVSKRHTLGKTLGKDQIKVFVYKLDIVSVEFR